MSAPASAAAATGERRDRLVGAPDGDAHPVVLDLDLANAGLLHDLHELADSLARSASASLGDEQRVARVRARGSTCSSRSASCAEHREQDELLLARGEPFGLLAHVLRGQRVLGRADAARRSTQPTARSTARSIGPGVAP